MALHAKDAALAKYKISEAETMAISGLTTAGTSGGVQLPGLPMHRRGTQKAQPLLGNSWSLTYSSSIPLLCQMKQVLLSLVGRHVPVPAWIRINNATSLPRVFYRRQCREVELG